MDLNKITDLLDATIHDLLPEHMSTQFARAHSDPLTFTAFLDIFQSVPVSFALEELKNNKVPKEFLCLILSRYIESQTKLVIEAAKNLEILRDKLESISRPTEDKESDEEPNEGPHIEYDL